VKLNFEMGFTKSEYQKFVAAVNQRVGYSFCHGKSKDKMQVRIYGTVCDNGLWKPENYLWSVCITDMRGGYSGSSRPLRVSELKTYDELVGFVYDLFKLPRPASFQQSFFD